MLPVALHVIYTHGMPNTSAQCVNVPFPERHYGRQAASALNAWLGVAVGKRSLAHTHKHTHKHRIYVIFLALCLIQSTSCLPSFSMLVIYRNCRQNASMLSQTANQPQNVDVSLRKRAIAATAQPFLAQRFYI